jgi:hypothetical protein
MIKLINAELIGWILSIIGTVVWVYGYFFSSGTPALIDWAAISPPWIAEFLPNRESEIGLAIMIVGVIPMYWPKGRNEGAHK